MVVYIAGPVTGLPENNRPAFYAAAAMLKSAEGVTAVLNPATLPATLPDKSYMPICMAMLEQSDAVYMLNGWEKSKGARAERLYAKRQSKLVIEQKFYGTAERVGVMLTRWEDDRDGDA